MWGGWDGPPPPVFTGQDLEEGEFAAPTRWLSDPAPPSSRGQDLDARTTGERDGRFANKPLPDGCQTGGRDGSPHPRGQRRERDGRFANKPLPDGCQTGGRDGSPHPRGQRGERDGRFANKPPYQMAVRRVVGMGPRIREDNGGERDGRFANSPYQMVVRRVGGMGPRPPSSRGQDLDARTTGGGAGRAVRQKPLPDGCQTGGRDGSLCSVHPPHF